jgi:D-beta-D-heptose 7-phosphate kinase/D-beta-D-heptose 1-phosphate adenosyltransferase
MINFQGKLPRLLVIGDLIIDHYIHGSCERISPEAPVQIIKVDSEKNILGGAGNVVNNLIALGAKTEVISVIGDCEKSKNIKTLLSNIGVSIDNLIVQKDRVITKKSRIIASQQQVVRYDCDSVDEISKESQDRIINTFNNNINSYDMVIFSDYGKGVLTPYLSKSLITIANNNGKKVLVDPNGLDYSKYNGAYLLTPNKEEASKATGININDKESLIKAITKLKNTYNLEVSLITLSEMGVAIYDNEFRTYNSAAKEVFDITGAGDTIIASLGFSLAYKHNIDDSIEFANLAAGVVVGKIGSASATINEIIEYESSLNKSTSDEHIKTLSQITALSKELKARDKKITFTNGCFDVLHAGHVRYLETAKSYGDILILGLNSDRSVAALKGEGRPINTQLDRAYILASLEAVDYVVVFDEDTPYDLIKAVKPHVLVKGSDYEGQEVVGQDIADDLKLVQFVDDKSTTNTIEKILQKN